MKNNDRTVLSDLTLEECYALACLWEEEPELVDPWERNADA